VAAFNVLAKWRRPVLMLAAIVIGTTITGSTARTAAPSHKWEVDFSQALATATETNKPLLVHFYGTFCGPCRQMDREVLSTAETMQLLQQHFVAVKVDAGDAHQLQSRQLVQRFGIESLPSDVILDPHTGRVLSQRSGYTDQRAFTATALRAVSRFDQLSKTQIARSSNGKASGTGASAAPAVGSAAEQGGGTADVILDDPQSMVGLDGFSPVALATDRRWVRGDPLFRWDFKGVTYHLASQTELDLFREHPEDYAPRLLGCDPVVLSTTDRAVPGSTKFGAYYDGELYLFSSADTRKTFKSNPPRYIRIQHVLRTENIERAETRVSERTEGEPTAQ
jgi:YHS domain-containing protein/thiol-disulfide isomerase/thioredoxin